MRVVVYDHCLGCTIAIAIAIVIVLYYVYNAHRMIFMYLCYALKAGPMKDLASAKSVAVCPQGWAYEELRLCYVWLFALKAGPVMDLAFVMSVAFCPLLRD